MRILVTGSTGFIGSNIMTYLENSGHIVFGCGRKQIESLKDRYFVRDLVKDPVNVDVDVIIHTAALSPSENAMFQDFFDNNCLATMNLLRYAKHRNVKRIIYMGAVSSYGDVDAILREDSPHNGPGDYGLTKYVAEKLVKDSGIPYYTLILPGVVGTGCRNNWIMNTARKLHRHEDVTYYNGQGLFNNILEVQDLCKYVGQLIQDETKKSDTYLLGSSERMSVEEIVSYMKDRLSSNSQLYCIDQKRNSFYLDVGKAMSNGFCSKPIKDTLDMVCEEILRKEES